MTMTSDEKDDTFLEPYFEAASAEVPEPSDALLARVMADADAVADSWQKVKTPVRAHHAGWLRPLLDAIGGWPSASGIVTAGIVGLVVGVSPPQALSDFASGYLYGTSDSYLVDPYDGFSFAADEG